LTRKHSISGDLLSKFDLKKPATSGTKLRELWELTELSANEFANEVARFFDLPRIDLQSLLAASSLVRQFSLRYLRDTSIYPCQPEGHSEPILVLADPTDASIVRAAELVLEKKLSLAIATFDDIATALSDVQPSESNAVNYDSGAITQHDDDIESLRDLASGAPVVRALNDLLEKALELRATDIHVEPFRTGLVLRMRIDGMLSAVHAPSNILPQALISRIKIISGLNIAERRLPQDGAAHLRIAGSHVDVRVATMPTQFGEAAVIRLLPKDRGVLDIAKLGLSDCDQSTIARLLKLPHGILVVTGPTGSGKTTTLATMLTILNDATRKILTIEDPVEYEIRGINQSQIKPEIGLTFAAAMRAFVRQDPDVIMVGEVRDPDTSHIAIHAALTGHLVLTTLHTETAAGAVPRLLDLGAEGFLLQSTLRAVMAQRLVRVLCDRCKVESELTLGLTQKDPRYAVIGLQPGERIFEPKGCERCSGTGYRGRTGIFEVIEIDDELRKLIASRADSATITQVARRAGMISMFDHGIAKCRAGVTSVAEILRVTTMN
jgi:general secretion pathway protein E